MIDEAYVCNSFLRMLKSLTKEELMRLFVSHNLSPRYHDMAIIDDDLSWLGSSTSYHLDRLPSFGKARSYLL